MSRVEDALMRLYENADLRDELTDDEAATLLKWAETELTRLDTPALDDETFEAQVDTLMKLLKQMNRYAGRQGQLSSQGVDETPGKIAALAVELGHAADAGQVAAAGTGEPGSTVAALTAMMSPAPPEAPPQPPAEQPTDAAEIVPAALPDTPPATPQPPTDANAETWEMDDDYEA
ncbi:MAG: hypothetical protein U0521_05795 [Anaerolineae bacterium]